MNLRISHIVALAEDGALDRATDSNVTLAVDLANTVADHGTGFTGTEAVSLVAVQSALRLTEHQR